MFSGTLSHTLNGKHVVFAELSANVETTWQCSVEDMRDLMASVKDRDHKNTVGIKHALYKGLSSHAPLGTINHYKCAQSECGGAILGQHCSAHSSVHRLVKGKPDPRTCYSQVWYKHRTWLPINIFWWHTQIILQPTKRPHCQCWRRGPPAGRIRPNRPVACPVCV